MHVKYFFLFFLFLNKGKKIENEKTKQAVMVHILNDLTGLKWDMQSVSNKLLQMNSNRFD